MWFSSNNITSARILNNVVLTTIIEMVEILDGRVGSV